MLEVLRLIVDIIQLMTMVAWLIVFYLYLKPKANLQEPKKDKYEDYRDPATGRLRGKKVGL